MLFTYLRRLWEFRNKRDDELEKYFLPDLSKICEPVRIVLSASKLMNDQTLSVTNKK